MNKTFKFLPLVAASAVLAGCQDYDLGFDAKEIAYKQSFEKAFGKVDPNQNWDLYGQLMAGENGGTRAATTAPLLGSVDISDLPEEQYAYLTKEQAERYKNMLPESEDTGLAYGETNLGRVVQNFKVKTKSFVLYPVHWNTSGSDVVGFYYHVPKGTQDAITITGTDGKEYYIMQVEFYDDKTHLYYTLNGEYGYMYFDGDSFYRVASFWNQLVELNPERYFVEGDTKKVRIGENSYEFSASNYYVIGDVLWTDLVSLDSEVFILADGKIKDKWNNTPSEGVKLVGVPTERTWSPVESQNALAVWDFQVPAKMLQSRGFKVTLPESTEIGMYLTNGSRTFYSESKLNYTIDWGGDIKTKDACFVATYLDTDREGNPVVDKDGNQVRYLCFEDWYGVKNFDLNDIVFRVYGFDGPGSEVVDEDSYTEEALLVCEDLGDDDFDFNDVVLKLSYQNAITRVTHYKPNSDEVDYVDMINNESIKVTPMAAGGANESTVTIHPANASDAANDSPLGEIHSLLNGSAPSIINAGPNFGSEGATISISAATYGASWDKDEYPTYLSMLFDKGFIKITSSGADATTITSYGSYTESGNVPQMMLLPINFEWPQERTYIVDAYSDFKNWVGDASATSWINTRDRSKVTKRNVIVTPTEPEPEQPSQPTEPEEPTGPEVTEPTNPLADFCGSSDVVLTADQKTALFGSYRTTGCILHVEGEDANGTVWLRYGTNKDDWAHMIFNNPKWKDATLTITASDVAGLLDADYVDFKITGTLTTAYFTAVEQ